MAYETELPGAEALANAHAWFLEVIRQQDDAYLTVELAEGIRTGGPRMVDFGGREIGPLTRVEVREDSRLVRIRFGGFVASKVVNESYAIKEEEADSREGQVLVALRGAGFDAYIAGTSGMDTILDTARLAWFLHTEEVDLVVLTTEAPIVEVLPHPPEVDRSRVTVWHRHTQGRPANEVSQEDFDTLTATDDT